MDKEEAIKQFEEWCKKVQAQPTTVDLRNKIRLEAHQDVLRRLKDKPIEEVFAYVQESEKKFAGDMRNGPKWCFEEYRMIRQKLWGLKK